MCDCPPAKYSLLFARAIRNTIECTLREHSIVMNRVFDVLCCFVRTIYLRSIPLQKTIAANVLTSVASTAGPTTAAGLALPYWLR